MRRDITSTKKGLLRALFVGGLVIALGGLAVWGLFDGLKAGPATVSGQSATLSLTGVPASVDADGPAFDVQVWVADVTNLGAYEWQLRFDPAVVQFVSAVNGPFLGSTGRAVACLPPVLPPEKGLEPGNVRFGCLSAGSGDGVAGSGLLSTVRFDPVADGAPNIQFVCGALADPFGEPIVVSNVAPCETAITPTATPEGAGPAPDGPSPTPGGPTATSGAPLPTVTPAGPTATPTPLPPGYEAVDLFAGCNPVTTTYPDATPVQTIAAAVGPAGNLEALWKFGGNVWLGYSPAYPQVSDLEAMDFLEVVFICVGGPGSFGRPIV